MHWIAQHVLIELTRHSTRRYSELRPDDVEGNLFLYHLNGLIRDKLIEKTDGSYQLTVPGRAHAATLSLVTGKTRQQPQINTAVICANAEGQILFYRWQREPNSGLVSVPHGLVHFGEPLMEAATRELAEKAGLTARLNYLGEIALRVYRGDTVERHQLIHVFSGVNLVPLDDEADLNQAFWSLPSDIEAGQWVPGFNLVIGNVDSLKTEPLIEITAQLNTE